MASYREKETAGPTASLPGYNNMAYRASHCKAWLASLYKTKSFHLFRGLPKYLLPMSCYFIRLRDSVSAYYFNIFFLFSFMSLYEICYYYLISFSVRKGKSGLHVCMVLSLNFFFKSKCCMVPKYMVSMNNAVGLSMCARSSDINRTFFSSTDSHIKPNHITGRMGYL